MYFCIAKIKMGTHKISASKKINYDEKGTLIAVLWHRWAKVKTFR